MASEGSLSKLGYRGQSKEQLLSEYSKLSENYETYCLNDGYIGPKLIADVLADTFKPTSRAEIRILDIGAGTGLVAKQLKSAGFIHMDALDPSTDMLQEARKLTLYENYYVDYITDQKLDIAEKTYDVVTGTGIYGYSHVPSSALHEMIRLVRPGGYIVLAARLEVVDTYDEFRDLEPLMNRLEQDGKWKKVCRNIYPIFCLNKKAILWKYQVLWTNTVDDKHKHAKR